MGARIEGGVGTGARSLACVVRYAVLGACLALLVGCVSDVTSTRLNTPPRPLSRRDPSAVEVFRERVPLDGYIEIHELEIDGGAMIAEDIQSRRVKAGSLGCEVLVLTPERYGPATMPGQKLRGTCLVHR